MIGALDDGTTDPTRAESSEIAQAARTIDQARQLPLRRAMSVPSRVRAVAVAVLGHPSVGVVLAYLVGIAWRVNYTLNVHPPEKFVNSDMQLYVALARKLLDANGPRAPWDVTLPLGFPSFLAFMLSDGGTLLQAGYAQMLVGCLVPGAVGLLGLAAFGPRTGMLAVVFASLYFPFIEYGALFLTEIHFTLWMALAFAGFLAQSGAPARRLARPRGGGWGGTLRRHLDEERRAAGGVRVLAAEGLALLLGRASAATPTPSSLRRAALRRWLLRSAMAALACRRLFGVMTMLCTHATAANCFSGNKPAAGLSPRPLRSAPRPRLGGRRRPRLPLRQPGLGAPNHGTHAKVGWVITDNGAATLPRRGAGSSTTVRRRRAFARSHLRHVLGSTMSPSFGHDSWPNTHLSQYVFVIFLAIRRSRPVGGPRGRARAGSSPAAPAGAVTGRGARVHGRDRDGRSAYRVPSTSFHRRRLCARHWRAGEDEHPDHRQVIGVARVQHLDAQRFQAYVVDE